jgi:hypothetical protein
MEQNPMGIENLDNKYQKVYPQLPLQHASEPSSASPARASKFIPVSPTISQATLPSVYSETTEPSLTLELTEDLTERPAAARHIGIHDMCNRNIEHMSKTPLPSFTLETSQFRWAYFSRVLCT